MRSSGALITAGSVSPGMRSSLPASEPGLPGRRGRHICQTDGMRGPASVLSGGVGRDGLPGAGGGAADRGLFLGVSETPRRCRHAKSGRGRNSGG